MKIQNRRAARSLVACAAVLAFSACAQRRPAPAAGAAAFGGALRYELPAGWILQTRSLYAGPDSIVLSGERNARIRLELVAGDPVKSETLSALKGAQWDSVEKAPAVPIESRPVAGAQTQLWRRVSTAKWTEEGEFPQRFVDEFCVVALQGRFVLLVYSFSGPSGSTEREFEAGRGAWLSLLASIRAAR